LCFGLVAKYFNGSQVVFQLLFYGNMISFLPTIMHEASHNIILDFFSSSVTTAHAVMQLNAEDGGNRKFIMVQLPEVTEEKSEAFKTGYSNICEIGKERIRRAGVKIKADIPLTTGDLDVGFRVLKLDSSNMKASCILKSQGS
jgi:adenine-specific DNA-methyltransferase